jgi:hypothetical protein
VSSQQAKIIVFFTGVGISVVFGGLKSLRLQKHIFAISGSWQPKSTPTSLAQTTFNRKPVFR